MLNLRPGVREHFLEALARDHPEQVERSVELYSKAYLPRSFDDDARTLKARFAREHGIADRRTAPIMPELQLSLL